jgi:hypothetical protein
MVKAQSAGQPRVFVSSPAILTNTQAVSQTMVREELAQRGIVTTHLERARYSGRPWQQLRLAISDVDGAVVFGARQLHILVGEWRPDTDEARSCSGWHATAWNQIEAGLAIMARVPVLAAPDEGVTEGIFSSDVWDDQVFGLHHPFTAEHTTLSSEMFEAWIAAVMVHARARG